jgi:hypothetical protein
MPHCLNPKRAPKPDPVKHQLLIVGHFFYYVGKGVMGEAKKAWLGEDQAKGIMGIGTAKRNSTLAMVECTGWWYGSGH